MKRILAWFVAMYHFLRYGKPVIETKRIEVESGRSDAPFEVPVEKVKEPKLLETPSQNNRRCPLRAWLNGHRTVVFETNAGGRLSAKLIDQDFGWVRLKRRHHPYAFWRQIAAA